MTKEEKHLWYDFLRIYRVRFSRQKVLGKYIADFYCAEVKLVIELDGSGHYTEEGKQYDEERTAFLEEYGLTVIRIPNTEIHKNFRGVCEYIDHLVEQSLSRFATAPFTQGSLFYVHLCFVNFLDKHCICVHNCKIRHISYEIYRILENCPLGYDPKQNGLFLLSESLSGA